MVVSKKEKKRRPLSAIVEATEALRHGPSPLKVPHNYIIMRVELTVCLLWCSGNLFQEVTP